MDVALTLLAVAVTVIAVSSMAERLRISAPLLLMLVGIGVSFVPGIEAPELTPDLVLFGLLPPLLYAAAIRTSLLDFRANLGPIASLSVLLVVVTALGVGLALWGLFGVAFPVAFAVGAVVAPPDAVAATAIARRVGMPRRLVTVLEGESLFNDATAITCLRVAILAIGGGITALEVTAGFAIAAVGGVVVGMAVAALAVAVRKHIRTPVVDTAVSLVMPYAAYLTAELIGWRNFHGSGVVAVVVTGLVLGHKSPLVQSGQSRLNERINWATIQFLLETAVFFLIGLQARRISADLATSALGPGQIAVYCAVVLGAVIGIRLAWVSLARSFLFRRERRVGQAPPWANTVVVGWAGLRGVVTLAAAFLLPESVPDREIWIFVAMVVTAGTLLLQGLTLPGLVRLLGLRGPDARSDALQAATVLQSASIAALAELDRVRRPEDSVETVQTLRDRIAARPHALWERLGRDDGGETPSDEYRRLRLATLAAERAEVLRIRSTGTVEHEVLEQVLGTLDVEESALTLATERAERLEEATLRPPAHPDGDCAHLSAAPPSPAPAGPAACPDCAREGTRTVHLRICLTCDNVGCCDSSTGRHAERHFQRTGHPVMQSREPGEHWRWCYVDERVG